METASPPRLILASSSPRRRQLLQLLGLAHVVRPADVEEHRGPGEDALDFVVRAAREKARVVAASDSSLPVLGADTVVEIAGRILGKPATRGEARRMLRSLSGASHHVHTAMALVVDGRCESLVDTAEVRFAPLDEAVITWYVDTGEPMDKAGTYAIQGAGGMLVDGIAGSPHTVVGLPIHRLEELFASCGLSILELLKTE